MTQTKERPILFSGEMVRAILSGRKTQTRRVVKPQPEIKDGNLIWCPRNPLAKRESGGRVLSTNSCPYGQPGDRLWVRETWSGLSPFAQIKPSERPEGIDLGEGNAAFRSEIHYWADGQPDYGDWERPRPSIHMPRWASRILLEVVSVRVERLQDISEKDALEEGITYNHLPDNGLDPMRARTWFRGLWCKINGYDSWGANPWVWVVEFRRIEQ